MNLHLHPAIACLWALVTVALASLVWLTRGHNRSPIVWWFRVASAQNMVQWVASFSNDAPLNYWCYWLAQALLHLLVLAALGQYAWQRFRWLRQLPQGFAVWAAVVMVAVGGTAVAVMCKWPGAVSDDGLLKGEHMAQVWLCGALWIVMLATKEEA